VLEGPEIELDGLDVFGRHERGLDQQELIDGPALDGVVDDLDFPLGRQCDTAPEQQRGQRRLS
jgi:hypothetical protein